jgi:hypothetical protein
MPVDPPEREIRNYISRAASEGAIAAAQQLSETLRIGLYEVLAAVQGASATLVGEGSLTTGAGVVVYPQTAAGSVVIQGPTVIITDSDSATATEGPTVISTADIEELDAQASQGRITALTFKQRILAAFILIAAVYPVLPPDVQQALLGDAALIAALAAVLALIRP